MEVREKFVPESRWSAGYGSLEELHTNIDWETGDSEIVGGRSGGGCGEGTLAGSFGV